MRNSIGTTGIRTRDLLACSAVPQPTAPPRAPTCSWLTYYFYKVLFLMTVNLPLFIQTNNNNTFKIKWI